MTKQLKAHTKSNKADAVIIENPNEKLDVDDESQRRPSESVKEINGPKGLEPTRYGDWESKGRCHDF